MGLFPMGHKGLARVPRKEMEDTLCGILCSVIPIQHNKKTNTACMAREWIYPCSHLQCSPILRCHRHWSFHISYLNICYSVRGHFSNRTFGFYFHDCVVFVAVNLSMFGFLHSWLTIVKQPLSHCLPLWTQKNTKSILHAFQAGKFCYWAYCFIMVSIIDIYELWNKT